MINAIKFNRFEYLILISCFLISGFFLVTTPIDIYSILSFISGITNALCVVLVARKDIRNFFFGLIAVTSYGIVSYKYGNTGEWMLNFFFLIPIQFIGYYLWKKEVKKNSHKVQAKKLKLKTIIILLASMAIAIHAYALVIQNHNVQMAMYDKVFDHSINKYYIDSFTTICCVFAQLLMLFRYREQWYLWICVNIMSIVLWSITFNPILIVQWAIMLVNAIHGAILWKKTDTLKTIPL